MNRYQVINNTQPRQEPKKNNQPKKKRKKKHSHETPKKQRAGRAVFHHPLLYVVRDLGLNVSCSFFGLFWVSTDLCVGVSWLLLSLSLFFLLLFLASTFSLASSSFSLRSSFPNYFSPSLKKRRHARKRAREDRTTPLLLSHPPTHPSQL